MKIKLQRDLKSWCEESGYEYHLKKSFSDLELLPRNGLNRNLKDYGFSREAAIAALSFYGKKIELAVSYVPNLSLMCWYWPNGEEVIYPINSAGSVYIGNSPEFWFKYYPFLVRSSDNLYMHACNPEEYTLTPEHSHENIGCPLYIGGQTHFGHFVSDKFSPLLVLRSTLSDLDISEFIVPYGHDKTTLELLEILWSYLTRVNEAGTRSVHKKSSQLRTFEIPKKNGIYHVGPAWVPSDHHMPGSQSMANTLLYNEIIGNHSKHESSHKYPSNSQVAYISRFPPDHLVHDRINNYPEIRSYFLRQGVDFIYPNTLSISDRINRLSNYPVLISDSGSCCLNAMLFGNPTSTIYHLQSDRILCDSSEETASQHYKNIPITGERLLSIIGQAKDISDKRSWYDRAEYTLNKFHFLDKF